MSTTARMMNTSEGNSFPITAVTAETAAAAMSTSVIGSASCRRNRRSSDSFFPSCKAFLPYFASLASASEEDRPLPSSGLSSSRRTLSFSCKYSLIDSLSSFLFPFRFFTLKL